MCFREATIVDLDGTQGKIYCSGRHIESLDSGKVYLIEKSKFIKVNTSDVCEVKTTPYSTVRITTKTEFDMFSNVKLAEETCTGTVMMFNDINIYNSCPEHKLV